MVRILNNKSNRFAILRTCFLLFIQYHVFFNPLTTYAQTPAPVNFFNTYEGDYYRKNIPYSLHYQQQKTQLNVGIYGTQNYKSPLSEAIIRSFELQNNVNINFFRRNDLSDLVIQHFYADFALVPNIDVIEMPFTLATRACHMSLLEKNWQNELNKFNELVIRQDFIAKAIDKCSLAYAQQTKVFAYDRNVFVTQRPQNINDFFDTKKFPGQRVLPKNNDGLLEWALLSQGVPKHQLYSLLSTHRGINLAFNQLNKIKPSIINWQHPQEIIKLSNTMQPMFVVANNELFFELDMHYGLSLDVVWDDGIQTMSALSLPVSLKQNNQQRELAIKFINHMTNTANQAKLANSIPYGPTRKSADNLIGVHNLYHVNMRDYLPTTVERTKNAIEKDYQWYQKARYLIDEKFKQWNGDEIKE